MSHGTSCKIAKLTRPCHANSIYIRILFALKGQFFKELFYIYNSEFDDNWAVCFGVSCAYGQMVREWKILPYLSGLQIEN